MPSEKKVVSTTSAPAPPPFLSQAIVSGDHVFCSGQIGADPKTGELVQGPIQERTKQILSNLSGVLEAAGSNLEEVVKVNIFLASLSDFGAVNEVYIQTFPDPKPARTCVAVKELPKGTDVEIECVARITKSRM